MTEIDTNDFIIGVEGESYGEVWKRRLRLKIKVAPKGATLIVRSGLQKAVAAAIQSEYGRDDLKIVKR